MVQETNRRPSVSSAQRLAEAGLVIALAKILDFIVLFRMPMGGSVTLAAMAPLFIFAIRWGWKWGILVGGAYGLVNVLLGGYVVHPLQMVFDYPLAFAMCGLAGLPVNRGKTDFISYLPAMIFATFMRFIFHVLSGMIFYSSIDFTEQGASLLAALSWDNLSGGIGYSIGYNGTFLLPDLIICLVIIGLLWKPLHRLLRPQF